MHATINLEDFFKNLGLGIKGRTLVALKSFPAGTVLLDQAPLTQVPLPSVRRQRCNYCLRRAALQCCGRCRSAYFCSNTCFRNAWLHYHHVLCEPLEYDTYTNVDADRWLLERAALTLHSHARLNKHNSHSPPHLKYAIQALEIHPQPDDGSAIINNTAPSSIAKSSTPSTTPTASTTTATKWLPTTTPGATTTSRPSAPIDFTAVSEMMAPFDCPFRPDELETVQAQISLSRFDILDPDQHMDKVGYGVYPLTTLYVQHSCLPTTGITYRQDKQRLIALRDINIGDVISISYVDLTLPRQARWDDLRLRFGPETTCECARCRGNVMDDLLDLSSDLRLDQASVMLKEDIKGWHILTSVKQQPTPLPTTLLPSDFTHYISRQSPSTSLSVFSKGDADFFQEVIPRVHTLLKTPCPAFSVNMIRAAEIALRHHMDHQKWVEAAKCATFLLVVYRLVYPALHPVCAFHAVILAKTCWNALIQLQIVGVRLQEETIYMDSIRSWIDIARHAVLATFGQQSGLCREIIDLQWVFERDQKLR